MRPCKNRIVVSNQYIKRMFITLYNDYSDIEILRGHDGWGRGFPQSIKWYEI